MLRTAPHEAAERVRRGLTTCWRCREVKPLTGFNAEPSARDGRRSDRRECERKTKRAYYR